jgi:hypothetical protein
VFEVSTGYSRGTRGRVRGAHGVLTGYSRACSRCARGNAVSCTAPRIPDGTVAGSCLCWAVRSRAADRGSIRAATCLARPQQDVGTAGPPRNGGRGRRGHMAALPTPVGRITNGTQAGLGVSSLAMGGRAHIGHRLDCSLQRPYDERTDLAPKYYCKAPRDTLTKPGCPPLRCSLSHRRAELLSCRR